MRSRVVRSFFGAGLLLISLLHLGRAQRSTGFAEVATGVGTLTLTEGERLRINAVVVFLHDNGEAQVRLIAERTSMSAGGRWFGDGDASKRIVLEITNDTEGGCVTGDAVVLLQEGCVPVASLTMSVSRPDGTAWTADFIEKKTRPCPNPGPDRPQSRSIFRSSSVISHILPVILSVAHLSELTVPRYPYRGYNLLEYPFCLIRPALVPGS